MSFLCFLKIVMSEICAFIHAHKFLLQTCPNSQLRFLLSTCIPTGILSNPFLGNVPFLYLFWRFQRSQKWNIGLEGTLMQISNYPYMFAFIQKNTLKTSHSLSLELPSDLTVKFAKYLFTNIQKQWNTLRSSLLFKKNTNFTSK